jgi:hypothetical protein
MHLVNCTRPQEPLENAPRTAVLEEWRWNSGGSETWDGFWSGASDDYYVRCTSRDGTIQWFRLEDDAEAAPTAEPVTTAAQRDDRRRVALIVAKSPNGRRILVGSARRASR